MSRTDTRRRASATTRTAATAIAVLAAFVVSRSHAVLADWLEPVRSEIPAWLAVGAGLGPAPLPAYDVRIAPEALRAAELMEPGDAATEEQDRWWVPATVLTEGRLHEARAQRIPAAAGGFEGLRIRFEGGDRPDGMRGLELQAIEPNTHLRDVVARETAAEVGLLAAPAGFARLSINASSPRLVHWRELDSGSMLQRLGLARGEIFRATARPLRGSADDRLPPHYVTTVSDRPAAAQAAALRRMVELVRTADDDRFGSEITSVVDVDQVLGWSALQRFFGDAGGGDRPSDPDWYFDPVSGLLRPIVRGLVAGGTDPTTDGPRDAERLVARLRALPEYRDRSDALLRQWVGVARSELLPAADRSLGRWAARLGAAQEPLRRAAWLGELALARREGRDRLTAHLNWLRDTLSVPSAPPNTIAASKAPEASALEQARIEEAVADTSLPLRIEGDRLVLPAGVHSVAGVVRLPASHRLVIEPGARLRMAPGASLLSHRGIEAIGTREAPIDIRGADGDDEPWGAIAVVRAPERSVLAHVRVAGGSRARIDGIEFNGQLSFNDSDLLLRDSDVRDGHGDDALSLRRGRFEVVRTRFIDNASDGFDAEWSSGKVSESLFANNGDDGLDLATSEVEVHRGWFRRMGDKAISAGERSRVSVRDSSLVDSQIAIASKEDSVVDVESTEFRRNEIGFSLYRDNRVFGAGYGTIDGGLFAENLRDFAVESGSELTLNGVERVDRAASGIVIGLRTAGAVPTTALP